MWGTAGAVARVTCGYVDEVGYETGPISVLSHVTDSKGYFFATLSLAELQGSKLKLTECKAYLESSPLDTCKVPTDVNHGISGAPLSSYRLIDNKIRLYSVGPFFCTAQVPKPVPNGYWITASIILRWHPFVCQTNWQKNAYGCKIWRMMLFFIVCFLMFFVLISQFVGRRTWWMHGACFPLRDLCQVLIRLFCYWYWHIQKNKVHDQQNFTSSYLVWMYTLSFVFSVNWEHSFLVTGVRKIVTRDIFLVSIHLT